MELRKIQLTGGSTHIVSLPKKWVDRNGLARSDTLAIHEEPDGSLLVVPHGEARAAVRAVNIALVHGEPSESIVRKLVGAYLAGADEIRVTCREGITTEMLDSVQGLLKDLVGVEIQDETDDCIVLEDLIGVADMDLSRTVTRMHRIARIMLDEALGALDTQDLESAALVSRRDDEVDRIEWMVTKQMHALLERPRLAASLDMRPAQALNYFLVARAIERMADHSSKIAKTLRARLEGVALDPNTRSAINSLIVQGKRVAEFWDMAFQALKRTDFAHANDAANHGRTLAAWKGEFSTYMVDQKPVDVQALTIMADSIDRIRGYAADIAETAMNHSFHHDA